MKYLVHSISNQARAACIFLILSMVFLSSCEDDEVTFQIDHLLKTWVYEALESDDLDPTILFNFDKILKDSEITFIHNSEGAGAGTYSGSTPNNPDQLTNQGTWQTNSTFEITSLNLDEGSTDQELFDVITLNANELYLSTEMNEPLQYKIKYIAK